MKRIALCAVLALCACSTAQQVQVAQTATTVQQQVAKACAVYNPIATDVTTLYHVTPTVDAVLDGLSALCATNASINTASIQTLAQTTIPAAVKALGTMPNVNQATVQELGGALTIINAALNLAIQTYVPTAAPASSTSGT
jgi:hypothetical protein